MSEEYCPICESEMYIVNRYTIRCKNKCYMLVRTGYRREETIFGQRFSIGLDEDSYTATKTTKEVKETIEYWRENDRYLIKLMEN